MKTELKYWQDVAMRMLCAYHDQRKEVWAMTTAGMDIVEHADADCCNVANLTVAEVDAITNGNFEEAYQEYCENNPPLHEYTVSYELPPLTGTVRVKALREDEAEEYVISKIYADGVNVCMSDEENMLGAPELDSICDYGNATVSDVEDDGEYEE